MVSQTFRTPELPRYLYHPKRYEHALGYPRLDVRLDDDTSLERGCQPLSLRVDIVDENRSIRHLHVHSKLHLNSDFYRICAGRLFIFEQDGETLQSFTFGGHLSVMPHPEFTSCVIKSAAPIIPLRFLSPFDLASRLTSEVEVLLAQRHAVWRGNPTAFEMRLAQTDPHQLYCACLDYLHREQTSNPTDSSDALAGRFSDYLAEEIEILHERGEWPVRLASITEML